MPRYQVVCGNFSTTIERENPEKAASDAIETLKHRDDRAKFLLGAMIAITELDDPHDTYYEFTNKLTQKHGLNYHAQDSKRSQVDGP